MTTQTNQPVHCKPYAPKVQKITALIVDRLQSIAEIERRLQHDASTRTKTTMPENFDVIVVGLGAIGSGTAYQLARRGHRVLGIDRFRPPHVYGSSHGHSRVIRQAYHEDARYIPYVLRTYDGWRELEQLVGKELLINTGIVLMGPPESELIQGAQRSADQHGLLYELLDNDAIRQRWPALRADAGMCGVWEPTGGILNVEACIQALLEVASESGAIFRFDEPVESWSADDKAVTVQTAGGTYTAAKLVISAGPWCARLLTDLKLPLWVERQVQLWFETTSTPEVFAPERCPIASWQYRMDSNFYAFPDLGHGVKVARHHGGRPTDPDAVGRDVDDDDITGVRELLQQFLPNANGPLKAHDVCLYTNTPDLHFIIDFHPDHPNVVIAGGFSGHGFKFAPVVGESVAQLLSGEATDTVLSMFRLERFQGLSDP